MRISDLSERHLPIGKNALRGLRGSYVALIVTMKPEDFIRLTTDSQESYDRIFQQTKVDLDTYRAGTNPEMNADWHGMPYLTVEIETGRVGNHEGRHRAAMVARAGGTSFPVGIIFKAPKQYVVTYEKVDYTDWDGGETPESTDEEETFLTWRAAEAREAELKAESRDLDTPEYYYRVNIDTRGGGTMKGSPRSPAYNDGDAWTYSAWNASDMPAQLIGQFDKSIVVPTSEMKVGVAKGYQHYRG